MYYKTQKPVSILAPYVRFFWEFKVPVTAGKPYVFRAMARDGAELLFHINGVFDEVLDSDKKQKSFVSGVHGQSNVVRRFEIHSTFSIFGAYLNPFALEAFFGIPAEEISNHMPDLYTLTGNAGDEIEEKIMLATNFNHRVALISDFLEKLLMKRSVTPFPFYDLLQSVSYSRGKILVNELAEKHCLSTRQFERKFKSASGFSPKLYARIVRFQNVVSHLPNPQKPLVEIAYECGYYDQSHFIHDFKQFSGYHPSVFFNGGAEGMEWMTG